MLVGNGHCSCEARALSAAAVAKTVIKRAYSFLWKQPERGGGAGMDMSVIEAADVTCLALMRRGARVAALHSPSKDERPVRRF